MDTIYVRQMQPLAAPPVSFSCNAITDVIPICMDADTSVDSAPACAEHRARREVCANEGEATDDVIYSG